MKFTVLTLFPDIVKAFFENSIMAKAVQKEIIAYDLVNIRDFAMINTIPVMTERMEVALAS
jgi:tRNA (guanine37-N1)-methyltransferase